MSEETTTHTTTTPEAPGGCAAASDAAPQGMTACDAVDAGAMLARTRQQARSFAGTVAGSTHAAALTARESANQCESIMSGLVHDHTDVDTYTFLLRQKLVSGWAADAADALDNIAADDADAATSSRCQYMADVLAGIAKNAAGKAACADAGDAAPADGAVAFDPAELLTGAIRTSAGQAAEAKKLAWEIAAAARADHDTPDITQNFLDHQYATASTAAAGAMAVARAAEELHGDAATLEKLADAARGLEKTATGAAGAAAGVHGGDITPADAGWTAE